MKLGKVNFHKVRQILGVITWTQGKGVNHLREGCSGVSDKMKAGGQANFQIAQA